MRRIILIGAAFISLLAVGCASRRQPTFADNMRDTASQWDKGNKLVKAGEEQIGKGEQQQRQGEKLIETGKTNNAQGEEKILEGESLIKEVEERHPESVAGQ
jgi:hypothetical protein